MSLLDQLLFSGANFLLNVLLARWLQPVQYGAFTLAYAAFLLLGTLHNALFTEPLLVFGSSTYAGRFQEYLGAIIAGHLLLVIPLELIMGGASFAFARLYSREMQQAFRGFALASPLILLMWIARRACYVRLQPGKAAVGGALYSVLLLAGVYLLRLGKRLDHGSAGIAMGLCALPTIAYLILLLRPKLFGQPRLQVGGVAAEHWRYGRWALSTAALSWLSANLYYALLPLWAGLEDVAGLRALANLAVPVLQAIGALSYLLLPLLGQLRRESPRRLPQVMMLFLGLFAAGSTIYLGAATVFRHQLLQLLYSGKYSAYARLVPLACLLPYAFGLTTVLGAALRAMERPDKVLWCYVGSNLVALACGIPLTRAWGIRGALLGQLLSSLVTGLLMLLSFRAVRRQAADAAARLRSDTLQWLGSVLAEDQSVLLRVDHQAPGSGWRLSGTFGWLGLGQGRAVLLPLDCRRAACGALSLYRPHLPGARILRTLLLLGLRAGLARHFLQRVRVYARVDRPPGDDGERFLPDYLRKVLGRGELLFGIYVGAAGVVQKPTLALLSAQGRGVGFAKIGWNAQTRALVENEWRALQYLASQPMRSGSFPVVRHFSRWRGRCVLITAPLPLANGPRGRAAQELQARFLGEVAGLRQSRQYFRQSGFLARLLRRRELLGQTLPAGHLSVLSQAIEWLCAELDAAKIPWVWRLGDFSPWNLGSERKGDRINVIDVEYAEEDSLPGWDLFHYLSQSAGRRLRRLDVAAAVRRGWPGYFEALGIDLRLVPALYAAYLCDLYTLWAQLWHDSGLPLSARAADVLDNRIQLLDRLLKERKPEGAGRG